MVNKKRQAKALAKDSQSDLSDNEESKHSEASGAESDDSDAILGVQTKKKPVILELLLPTGETEILTSFTLKMREKKGQEGGVEAWECTLAEVLTVLKRNGYPLENSFVSFFSPVFLAYINCGLDPIPKSIKIIEDDLTTKDNKYMLKLRFKQGVRSEY